MRLRKAGASIAAGALAVAGNLVLAGPAQAANVGCGEVITSSKTLNDDVGPCPKHGIVIRGDNVTLDLNGHRVFGTEAAGDGAGVLVQKSHGVTVMNGTVTDFDGGVVIRNGGGNTVKDIAAQHNIGESEGHTLAGGTAFGDGILLEGTSDNFILHNRAEDNGPFSGIGLVELPDSDHAFPGAPTSGNILRGNIVLNNTACRKGPFCDNDGIRLEPLVGPDNVVVDNDVAGNGLDGISLFADTDNNVVRGNRVAANGFHGAVPGDGIRIFASYNLIEDNSSAANAAGGVSVGARTIIAPNQFTLPNCTPTATRPCPVPGNPRGQYNRLFGNDAAANKILDLWDSNPGCDNNVWRDNTFQTAKPPCTRK